MQSTHVNRLAAQIERTADEQRWVGEIDGQKVCRVTFRAQIQGQWYTAQGQSQGITQVPDNQLCAQALDTGRVRLLESVGAVASSVTQDTICTDRPMPKWRPVQVGDHIQESQVAPDPQHRETFQYLGQDCRWFMETVPRGAGGLEQNRGIMCRIRATDWYILKKWVHARG